MLPVFHNPYPFAAMPTHPAPHTKQHPTHRPSHLPPISRPFPQTTRPRNHTTPASHSNGAREQSPAALPPYPLSACHFHRSYNCVSQQTCEPLKRDNPRLLSCCHPSGGKAECSPQTSTTGSHPQKTSFRPGHGA